MGAAAAKKLSSKVTGVAPTSTAATGPPEESRGKKQVRGHVAALAALAEAHRASSSAREAGTGDIEVVVVGDAVHPTVLSAPRRRSIGGGRGNLGKTMTKMTTIPGLQLEVKSTTKPRAPKRKPEQQRKAKVDSDSVSAPPTKKQRALAATSSAVAETVPVPLPMPVSGDQTSRRGPKQTGKQKQSTPATATATVAEKKKKRRGPRQTSQQASSSSLLIMMQKPPPPSTASSPDSSYRSGGGYGYGYAEDIYGLSEADMEEENRLRALEQVKNAAFGAELFRGERGGEGEGERKGKTPAAAKNQ